MDRALYRPWRNCGAATRWPWAGHDQQFRCAFYQLYLCEGQRAGGATRAPKKDGSDATRPDQLVRLSSERSAKGWPHRHSPFVSAARRWLSAPPVDRTRAPPCHTHLLLRRRRPRVWVTPSDDYLSELVTLVHAGSFRILPGTLSVLWVVIAASRDLDLGR